jgi:DNA-binding transcriptional ArsR family regulator
MNEANFHKLLYQPTRLAVLAHLARCGGEAAFLDVCRALDIEHPGALSAHNRVLEGAGLIELRRGFVGRKPRTSLVLTRRGRLAILSHIAAVNAMSNLPAMEAIS